MNTERRVLDQASARWNDYVGTVSADDADAAPNQPSLYELAHLDRNRWMILAIDLMVNDGVTAVSVHAIDRLRHGITGEADVLELAGTLGEVPVVEFSVPETHVEQFISGAFKQISLRLVSRGVRDLVLVSSDQPT
jgi:hypothetical protein